MNRTVTIDYGTTGNDKAIVNKAKYSNNEKDKIIICIPCRRETEYIYIVCVVLLDHILRM